jgi:hypothetical protein
VDWLVATQGMQVRQGQAHSPLWGSVRSYLHRYTRSGISNENATRTQRQRDINETSPRQQRNDNATSTTLSTVLIRFVYWIYNSINTVSIKSRRERVRGKRKLLEERADKSASYRKPLSLR